VIAVVIIGATYVRMYFGADFTDQAYYVAVPYRFVLGARPFIDETTPSQQSAGLLGYPFIWAYHALFGVSGIILFARHLHFLFFDLSRAHSARRSCRLSFRSHSCPSTSPTSVTTTSLLDSSQPDAFSGYGPSPRTMN
jgi:hypothetical protein